MLQHVSVLVHCVRRAEASLAHIYLKTRAAVNGDTYHTMITDFFVPALDDNDVDNVWFQQDGATCHTSHATIDLLRETFDGQMAIQWLIK